MNQQCANCGKLKKETRRADHERYRRKHAVAVMREDLRRLFSFVRARGK